MEKETTKDDILKAIKDFAELTPTKDDFSKLDNRLAKVETRLTSVESKMVTKDYLDKKLNSLQGNLISTLRKEDNKLKFVVNKLNQKKVFSRQDKAEVFTLEPFPEINQ